MTIPAIRVGVAYGQPHPAEHGAYWVEVGGVRLEDGVLGVTYEAHGAQFNTVTIRLCCSSFASVRADGETEDLTGHSGGFGRTEA